MSGTHTLPTWALLFLISMLLVIDIDGLYQWKSPVTVVKRYP